MIDWNALLEAERAGLAAAMERVLNWHQGMVLSPEAADARLGAMIDEHLQTGGKRLRGLLPAALVRAGGGPVQAAWTLGACIELVHNGTLVHDDIQDGDELRRGRPTLWKVHGAPQAINVGDALYAAPLAALALDPSVPRHHAAQLAGLLAGALLETIRGQVADLDLHGDEEPDQARLEAVAIAKTAPLFGVAIEGAGLLLEHPASDAAREAGRALGLAFQLRDDLLDLVGSKGRGAAGADLREGKLTLPGRLALRGASADEEAALRALLARAAAGDRPADDEVAHWVAWMHERGGVEAGRAALDALLSQARDAAVRALPAPAAVVLAAFADRLGALDG
ncbi:MAG: hypothetical protein RIT45_2688 [Pseudomonadota bacterium]